MSSPDYALLEQLTEGALWVCSTTGGTRFVGSRFETIVGVSRDAQLSNPGAWTTCVAASDRARVDAFASARGGDPASACFVLGDEQESRRSLEVQRRTLVDSAGNALTVFVAHVQRPEVGRTACTIDPCARALEVEKMEALHRFANALAHDFGNALNVIALHAESIRRADGPERVASAVSGIEAAVRKATHVTELLRGVAVDPTDACIEIDVRETLQRVVAFTGHTCRGRIALRIGDDAESAIVRAVPSLLEQVALNLVTNAVEAIDGTGTVQVDVKVSTEQFEPGNPVDAVIVTIEDDGCGMPPHVRARVFEPFFTTKARAEHHGLGLTSAYAVVTRAGGRIDIATEVGAGTCVSVRWPAGVEAREPVEQPRHGAVSLRSLRRDTP